MSLQKNTLQEISSPTPDRLPMCDEIRFKENTKQPTNIETLTAVIATQLEPSQWKRLSRPRFGGYGIAIIGTGKSFTHWGAGCAKSQFPFIAFAIHRILQMTPPERKLIIYAEKGIIDHIGPTGHIWKAMKRGGENSQGKRYEGYTVTKEIAEQLKMGSFSLVPYKVKSPPDGFECAKRAAREGLKQAKIQVLNLEKFSDVGIFVTDENPSPPSDRALIIRDGE